MSPLEEYLGQLSEWKNDEERRSLFSSFSKPRSVNPEAYDARLQFWKKLLLEVTNMKLLSKSVFCIPDSSVVAHSFSHHGSLPLGISQNKMLEDGEAIMNNNSTTSNILDEEYLLTRLARMVITKPIIAGLKWLSGAEEEDESHHDEGLKTGPIVAKRLLEAMSQKLVSSNAPGNVEKKNHSALAAISYSEFTLLVQSLRSKENLSLIEEQSDFVCLINFMKRSKLISIIENPDYSQSVIKIKGPGEKVAKSISKEEADFVKLTSIHKNLEKQLEELSEKIISTKIIAKNALDKKDRQLALHELKKSKLFETRRGQRMQAATTIHEILMSIENAVSDVQVFEAFKSGQAALHQIASQNGLSVDGVDDLMCSIQDALQDQADISAALISSPNMEFDADLELELEQILLEKQPISLEENIVASLLPQVPLPVPKNNEENTESDVQNSQLLIEE